MSKTILLTGSTDGIGRDAAKKLLAQGHRVLLHGRNQQKLKNVVDELSEQGSVESYLADLSDMNAVRDLAKHVAENHKKLDVLINNAGILKTSDTITKDGFDVRFAVNTLAPYLLTKKLLPIMDTSSRVVNVSSVAQAYVDLEALTDKHANLGAMEAYSQSKLAIIMWSFAMARSLKDKGPIFVAVHPGTLLSTKMVWEGFGINGNDSSIGSDILVRAAVSEEFADANGTYFDNDNDCFADPHRDALDSQQCDQLVAELEKLLRY